MEASEIKDECSTLASAHLAYADVSDIPSDQSWGDSIMKPFSSNSMSHLVSWMCVTLGVCCEGEMQYTDNVLLMMLEQEVAELKEAASRQMGALSGKKAGFRWSSQYTKIKMIKVSVVVGLAPLFCDFHQPNPTLALISMVKVD